MRRTDFNELIDRAAFQELFITEMGWNNPSNSQPLYISIDNVDYDFVPVAEKSGFQVYTCTLDVIPTASECKKIDNKLRNYGFDYICIFIQEGTLHHLWLTPVKTNEKRELVKTEYLGGAKADFLFSKVDDLTFEFTERVLISDVKARVQGSFHLNSEKVTKDFYAQFCKEHKAFTKHIVGIENEKDRDWYASVMLNRLMFCYFIQKKGFLNLNANYLQDKLKWVQEKKGNDQFFETFYQGFLRAMFHDGLNNPRHSAEFEQMYGRIPYLNGGMFDEHQLERENYGIDIADEAFKNLFDFFDKWNWHLDTRLTASGKDINPDVLGYIFEQYINDRAAMGAYYTKEDITEYIGKNCIIPFLMDKVAKTSSAKDFSANGFVWNILRESGDRYIYDAVKKGYTPDWQKQIPDYIYNGIDTTQPNLLERRGRWNEKTSSEFALPTEIWRETVERLKRCDSLVEKIRGGEIKEINDFITYNLDIRTFVEDLIRKTKDHLFVEHTYQALRSVTILDPTCGSGAFLFAALNILEPLYEACLDRMEEWNKENPRLFERELGEIVNNYRSNRQYFIYKNIILRNLYGVDIMVEATEIAKLRLFLKMVAVVDVDYRADNMGLDPLPDIDFNIKCGNTLVGYPTQKELERHILTGDFFARQEFQEKIEEKMNVVAVAYSLFRSEQLRTYDDNASLKETKRKLKERLAELNDLLNRHLYTTITDGNYDYDKWLASHQPFHWIAEFYEIMHGNGGFDVIIGNPPYVVFNENKSPYKIDGYKTYESKNLYSYVFERSFNLCNNSIGLIVQMSSVATESMKSLQSYLLSESEYIYYSIYPERPKQLFDGACIALSIIMCYGRKADKSTMYGSGISRFHDSQRSVLFKGLKYIRIDESSFLPNYLLFPKFGKMLETSIFAKLKSNAPVSRYFIKEGSNVFSYRTAGGRYWKPFINRHFATQTSTNKSQAVIDEVPSSYLVGIFNSNLFWWYYANYFDLFHLTSYMFSNFRYSDDGKINMVLARLGKELMNSFELHKIQNSQFVKSQNREAIFESFNPQLSKHIIDEIDKVLAKHYGFTEEELDFIINYDIKYRMGDELNSEE